MIVTPGTQLQPGDLLDRPRANLLGQPTVALEDGEVLGRHLAAKAIGTANLGDDVRAQLGGIKNYVVNGRFDFARRDNAANNPASAVFPFDRWRIFYDGTVGTTNVGTIASNSVGYGPLEDLAKVAMRWNQTVAGAGDSFRYIEQRIEDARTLGNRDATLSFLGTINAGNSYQVDVVRNYGTGGSPSPEEVLSSTTILGTSGWTKQEIMVAMGSVGGKSFGTNNDHYIGIRFRMPLNAIFDFYLALVQFEQGSVASAFEQRSYQLERFMCDRYYRKSYPDTIFPGTVSSLGAASLQTRTAIAASTAGVLHTSQRFAVQMRATPALKFWSAGTGAANAVWNASANADRTGVTATAPSSVGFIDLSVTNVSATAIALDDILYLQWEADAEL